MISFPNAKINIGLSITEKRADGFHNIESIFYPINWCDVLEIIPSTKTSFVSSGIEIPGKQENNLCLQVYNTLKNEFNIPPVRIHLKKIIPIGAGLGGGSSDAAFTLKMLNEMFELKLTNNEMEDIMRPLGSDCPFFIKNKPMFAHNKGDHFIDALLDLTGYHLLVVNPNIHISTKEAYSGITPTPARTNLQELTIEQLLSNHKLAKNDFENSIFPNHAPIKDLKEGMGALGAKYASMSGSGSTVYGIFEEKPDQSHFDKQKIFSTVL